MVTFYHSQAEGRADAARQKLREKVVCVVVNGPLVLVFEHEDAPEAGVQLPAGGVEPGETPAEAAVRELREESGLSLSNPRHVISYRWEAQLPERFTRQVCHAFAFTAPPHLPTTWTRQADGHPFAFRWASLEEPGLDWELDAALPSMPRTSPA
ncbi:MAG: NUDIX domain-containing protein [Deinococcota bacterium]